MKNFLSDILGPRLREARKAKALTSIVCAKAVGVSQPAWNMWDMGVRLPKIELLAEICDLLEVTPNHLLGFDATPTSAPPREIKAGAIKTGDNSPVVLGDGNTVVTPPKSTSTSRSMPRKSKPRK